jgi:hypothetical protein
VQAEHLGVAAGGRGVEVRQRPRAAVDVVAAADPHRLEHPGDRARGDDRLGHGGARRADAAEHDAATAPAVHAAHAQPAVEARAESLEVGAQPVQALAAVGHPRERERAQPCARRRAEREQRRHERGRRPRADPRGAAQDAPAAAGRRRVAREVRGGAAVARAAGALARRQPRRDDRSGGRPDVRVAVAQVDPRGVLDPRQDAAHPCLAQDPAGGEHEHVGVGSHRRAKLLAQAPNAVCDNVRLYDGGGRPTDPGPA